MFITMTVLIDLALPWYFSLGKVFLTARAQYFDFPAHPLYLGGERFSIVKTGLI